MEERDVWFGLSNQRREKWHEGDACGGMGVGAVCHVSVGWLRAAR